MAANCPDELEADFEQFYHIDVSSSGHGKSLAHIATLASQLPRESRVAAFISPEAQWSQGDHMLADIFDLIAIWATGGKSRSRKYPRPKAAPREVVEVECYDEVISATEWEEA